MNQRIVKNLLIAALALSAAHLAAQNADQATNKTFLMPRPVGVNAAMQTANMYTLLKQKNADKFGGTLAITGFYQQAEKGNAQGEYFLAYNQATIDVSRSAPIIGASYLTASAVDAGLLIHTAGIPFADNPGASSVSLAPNQEVSGAFAHYHHDLSKLLLPGLYLSANLPIVTVSNDPHLSVRCADAVLQDRLVKFFTGADASGAAASDAQEALKNGKMCRRSKTGVADIDVVLGHEFLHDHDCYAGIGFGMTIPTGNTATGEYLFEPMVGNGGSWGLGFDFFSARRLWESTSSHMKINFTAKYRYLLAHTQRRVLSLFGNTQVYQPNLSQYQLLQKNGAAVGTPLVPAANISALPVKITPGSQLDFDVAFNYRHGWFSLDFGYNLYLHEAETIKRRQSLPSDYAIVARSFSNAHPFNVNNLGDVETGFAGRDINLLTDFNLYLPSAATGAQCTHAIFTGLGCTISSWKYPVIAGIGAKYEWTATNNALEQYALWGKLGIGF